MLIELTPVQFSNMLVEDQPTRIKNSVEILLEIKNQSYIYAMREWVQPANEPFLPTRKMQEALATWYHVRGALTDEELTERLALIAKAHTFTR